MSDKDHSDPESLSLSDESSKDAESTNAKPKAKRKLPPWPEILTRAGLGTAGLLLVVGFFFPWLQGGDFTNASGLDLVISDNEALQGGIGETQRWLLLIVPVFGLILASTGYLGFRWAGQIGVIVGMAAIGYGAFTVVVLFLRVTDLGLWLTLIGAFLSVMVGVLAWARSRKAKDDLLARGKSADDLDELEPKKG